MKKKNNHRALELTAWHEKSLKATEFTAVLFHENKNEKRRNGKIYQWMMIKAHICVRKLR